MTKVGRCQSQATSHKDSLPASMPGGRRVAQSRYLCQQMSSSVVFMKFVYIVVQSVKLEPACGLFSCGRNFRHVGFSIWHCRLLCEVTLLQSRADGLPLSCHFCRVLYDMWLLGICFVNAECFFVVLLPGHLLGSIKQW